jgi:hypothetical protein
LGQHVVVAREQPPLELELLPLDEGIDGDREPAAEGGGQGAGWAAVVAAVVALLVVAAAIGRADVAPEVTVVPPEPTVHSSRGGPQLPISYVVAGADGHSLIVSGEGWTGRIAVDPALGEVTSVAGGRGFVVGVVSSGQAWRWSAEEGQGVPLGPAELTLVNVRDESLVWLVSSRDGRQEVRTIVASAGGGSRAVPVPEGWKVVGVNGQGLVLVREESGRGVAIWEPWEVDDPSVLDAEGSFLASSVRRVAWLRDGELIESGSPFSGQRMVMVDEGFTGAAYAPDGIQLAMVAESRGDRTWVRFLDADGSIDEGFEVKAPRITTFGWTADGDFVADPGGAIEYRYDPRWGLTISDRRLMG